MRFILAALPLVPMLAACGASDEAARNTFRQSSIDSCVSASSSRPQPALAGFDWERLCTCATDRIMEGKSARELIQMEPGAPEHRQAVEQCVLEIQRDGALPATG